MRFPMVVGSVALPMLLGTTSLAAQAQRDTTCTPTQDAIPASTWIHRAIDAARLDARAGHPLHVRFVDVVTQDYQSDRTYPPYLVFTASGDLWFDVRSGVERMASAYLTPYGSGPVSTTLGSERSTYVVGPDSLSPSARRHNTATYSNRPLDALAVLYDWRGSPQLTVLGVCAYRGYPRVVLGRQGPYGPERLFVSTASGLPIKLDRDEIGRYGVWGSRHVEYLYTNWLEDAVGPYPSMSYRIVDDTPEITRLAAVLPEGDSVPALALPHDAPDMTGARAASLAPPSGTASDTVRVGPQTYLLRTRYYTNTVTLIGDTVYMLDAQYTGEPRAEADSAWLGRLFPGHHPIVLVVSDLAWPHIAGLRYWVANGARVVSHRLSESFLRRVVERRWTAHPDLLERRRSRVSFRFQPVTDSLVLAGGGVRVYAIDGIGSEGAVMTYLPRDHYLFAGDFIQTVRAPSAYAREVRDAVRRVGIAPERVAAMHLPLTPWRVVDSLLGADTRP